MPKKAARKTTKPTRKVSTVKATRKNDSFINWTHEHPLYFLIAIALALIVLIMVNKLVSIRNQVDQIEEMNTQQIVDDKPMPKVSVTPSAAPRMMKGY